MKELERDFQVQDAQNEVDAYNAHLDDITVPRRKTARRRAERARRF
jgi:hypothetical protein